MSLGSSTRLDSPANDLARGHCLQGAALPHARAHRSRVGACAAGRGAAGDHSGLRHALMGQLPLLEELAVVAALAVAVTLVLSRLKLPAVAGLLAAGALLGPYGLRLATSVHAIEVLADVGVVLLLFSIGLEFSLTRLRDIFRQVALGGVLQVGLTTAAATGVALALGQPLG